MKPIEKNYNRFLGHTRADALPCPESGIFPPLRVAESAEQWGEGRGEVAAYQLSTLTHQPS